MSYDRDSKFSEHLVFVVTPGGLWRPERFFLSMKKRESVRLLAWRTVGRRSPGARPGWHLRAERSAACACLLSYHTEGKRRENPVVRPFASSGRTSSVNTRPFTSTRRCGSATDRMADSLSEFEFTHLYNELTVPVLIIHTAYVG